MSVERFIEGLEERGLLSDRVLGKLREKLAQSERPLSPKALAKFLVDKRHLTQRQATEVLGSLLRAGVDVDPEPAKDAANTKGVHQFTPVADDAATDLETDEPEDDDSSIFEPFLTRSDKKQPPAVEAELGLAHGSDDAIAEVIRPPELAAPPVDDRQKSPAKKPSSIRDRGAGADTPRLDQLEEPPAAEGLGTPKKPPRRLSGKHERTSKAASKKKPVKRASQWDSPLILLGGGALALLVIGGATLAWLLNWKSGDDQLKLAQEAVNSGSYTQGIAHYQEFLERFPRHRERGAAQVKLATTRLRKATEAAHYTAALEMAQTELKAVEDEEKFGENAHAELAALLPRIALGLAEEAEAAAELDDAKKLVEKATAALVLAGKTKYVPSSLRDEAELGQVRLALARVERRQKSKQELRKAVEAMRQAIAAGDTRAAYATRIDLVKQHPELAADATLAETVKKTTAAEQAAIRFAKEEQAAETSERPTPWLASLAVANRRVKGAANEAGPDSAGSAIAVVRVDGAVYGLDSATGRLLWRRYVGYAPAAWPILIGRDVVVADVARHEILRLDAATGQLKWRQAIGEPFADPLVVGERGFVAAESGRLYVIDWKAGTRLGYWQFAQPLRVPPVVDRNQQRMYLAGDHSSLYSLALADPTSIAVFYLGHAAGSITVPLVPVMDKLAVCENDGVATSRMRLMSLGEQSEITGQVVERRLNGLATSAPFVAGRRLIVITDRGQIEVYEVATGGGDKALTEVATRAATGTQPLVRHAALVDRHIWLADTQLTKYSILPTGNRLPVEAIDNNFAGATFDHPLALFGETLVHIRRPKGRAGVVVAASETGRGRTLWETDLAVPPAGPPVVDESTKTLAAANAEGYVFRFDEAAIRSHIKDEPLAIEPRPSNMAALTTAVDLGRGRAAFCAAGSEWLVLYDSTLGDRPAKWIQLASPLACAVTPMGEGLIAPSTVGQVFYLSAANGAPLATPFQPVLEPNTTWDYKPAGVVDAESPQFVISDGREKIYLVAVVDQPQPHLKAVAEANAGPYPIESPIVVLGDTAFAAAGSTHLVRFRLPKLEPAGDANLPAPVVWGPFRAGESILLATADGHLTAVSAQGDAMWNVAIDEHGDLAGAPLVLPDSVLLAYRKGIVERRALADGKQMVVSNVEQPLAAGPVQFLQRLVLTANDGTLLVIDQP